MCVLLAFAAMLLGWMTDGACCSSMSTERLPVMLLYQVDTLFYVYDVCVYPEFPDVALSQACTNNGHVPV